jgi:nicotinamide-nucleotide amidase
MALNVAKLYEADWSIATTGYCTPIRNSSYKIFAFFSFSYKGEIIHTGKLELHPKTQALNAQLYYTEFILGCFKTEVSKHMDIQSRLQLKTNGNERIKVS